MNTSAITLVLGISCVVACGSSGSDGDDSPAVCENTCRFASDGECDDGGPGSMFDECALGTDCDDCGPRNGTTCTCDTSAGCEPGCLCDPDCGQLPIGGTCACGPDSVYCSDTNCATSYCLWDGGLAGYCSQTCGSCPGGYECRDIFGGGTWCAKIQTVPNCGTCTHSADCQPFFRNQVYIAAACFNGRCRLRCSPGSGACSCLAGSPAGGGATGYCADDGC